MSLIMTESQLVNSLLEYCERINVFAKRQNTGAYKTERGGFVRFGVKGSGDIIIVIGGQHIEVEAKVGKNKQSTSQKEYQNRLEDAGGLYWLCYSLEDLKFRLDDFV